MHDAYGAFQATTIASTSGRRLDYDAMAVGRAVSKFHNLRARATLRRLLGKLTRQPRGLLDLEDARRARNIENIHETGCVTVEVAKIRGSESRTHDFDRDFLPLNVTTQQRWVSVYAARLCGISLPAITLVQVGAVYYVRDGHHRVSVARVLGEQYIEATVQVWEAEGEVATAPAMAMQLVTVT